MVLAVDDLAAHDPGFIDGQFTVIARRKSEAYGVIADSHDEVFLTNLYDWYLNQGWSDRLLQTESPFVITYLQRKSVEDISHADLLWQYFAHYERFFEAAQVQNELARSAFAIPLSRRIEYLGRARANASAFTPDVSRQQRQYLLHNISSLIDVANIQDDILQKVKDEDRMEPAHKADTIKLLDQSIMDITVVGADVPILPCL